jgi:hypothetical protein
MLDSLKKYDNFFDTIYFNPNFTLLYHNQIDHTLKFKKKIKKKWEDHY